MGYRYVEIADALRDRITRGDYTASKRLPSERRLLTEFGVQRDTVRRALKVLESEGHLFRSAARGTFLAAPLVPPRIAPPLTAAILFAVRRDEDSIVPGDVMRGLSQTLAAHDRTVLWMDTRDKWGENEAPAALLETLKTRGIVGTAIWPRLPAPIERLTALRDAMPLVLLDREVPGFASDFVGFEDFNGGKAVTEHLLRLGHRRIGFLSHEALASTVQARARGYVAALKEAGVSGWPGRILHLDESKLSLSPELTAFLDGSGSAEPSLSAVVCANDTVAAQLIGVLRGMGRRVPDDIAVTGFGNLLAPFLDALGLTTVAQPLVEMGHVAGRLLVDRLNGETSGTGPYRRVELPVTLIVRASCGHARVTGGSFKSRPA